MTGLKVYVDFMSQPSRAVLLFLKKNQIQYEEKIISIQKGNIFWKCFCYFEISNKILKFFWF